jgi:hypothetical protein
LPSFLFEPVTDGSDFLTGACFFGSGIALEGSYFFSYGAFAEVFLFESIFLSVETFLGSTFFSGTAFATSDFLGSGFLSELFFCT